MMKRQIKNNLPDLSSNETIRDAIRKIALGEIVHRSTGTVRGTEKVFGYVTKIHLDESDELYGTIDVQEYSSLHEESGVVHEGVFITAIQNDISGLVVIPKLYSEVVVAKDSDSGKEYVTMFSHVDTIQLDSHEKITVGVKEREPYDTSDSESPDIEDLPATGKQSLQTFAKDSVVTEVIDDEAGNKSTSVIKTSCIAQNVNVGDNKSSMTMTEDVIELKRGSSLVKVTDGVTYVGDDAKTDDAVLGVALAGVLEDLLDALVKVKTTTQLGPQPFLNVAQFASMKGKISAYKKAHSGFLTNKVLIQK